MNDLQAEIDRLNAEISASSDIKELMKMPGWERIAELLNKQIAYYTTQMLEDSTHPKEMMNFKADINARRHLLRQMQSLVDSRDKKIRKRDELQSISD